MALANLPQHAKTAGDVISFTTAMSAFGAALATLAGWLPAIAAAFSIAWTGMRMWEHLRGKRKDRKDRKERNELR